MLASLLIIGFSVILLVYWFRYSCMLLLRNFSEEAVLSAAAPDSRFSFVRVQELLKGSSELDPLSLSLDRDYQVISYLISHAPGLGEQSIEEHLLNLDYKLMK